MYRLIIYSKIPLVLALSPLLVRPRSPFCCACPPSLLYSRVQERFVSAKDATVVRMVVVIVLVRSARALCRAVRLTRGWGVRS